MTPISPAIPAGAKFKAAAIALVVGALALAGGLLTAGLITVANTELSLAVHGAHFLIGAFGAGLSYRLFRRLAKT